MTVTVRAFRGGGYLSMVVRSPAGDELWSMARSRALVVLVVVLDAPRERPTFAEYDTHAQLNGASLALLLTDDGAESVIPLPWLSAHVRTKCVPYCLGLEGAALEVIEIAPCLPDALTKPIVRWAAGMSVSPLGFFLANVEMLTEYAAAAPDGNILERLTTSDDGDQLLKMGAIVPVLGVPAWSYLLVEVDPSASADGRLGAVCVAPQSFPFSAPTELFDGEVLQEWNPSAGCRLPLSASAWFELRATSVPVCGSTTLITWCLRATEARQSPGDPIINPDIDSAP